MNILCIGHRGAKGHSPENTLPSFEKAINLGCPWVELDVHLVEDELVVMHDETVNRTTNGKGKLATMRLADLRELDAGEGAVVPLLKEVIELVDHRAGINVELKGPGTAAACNQLLDEYCQNGWDDEEFLLSSFQHDELAKADPRWRRGILYAKDFTGSARDIWQQAEALGAWSVNLDRKLADGRLVAATQEQGYAVLAYTVNEPSEIRRLIDVGVNGIFSDYPDRVLVEIAVEEAETMMAERDAERDAAMDAGNS